MSKEQTLAAIEQACGAGAKAGFVTLKKAALADDNWRQQLLSVAGAWRDRDDLDEFYKALREADRRRLENPISER